MSFFSDIRNKFDAKYSGRYLGHLFELVGKGEDRRVFFPLIGKKRFQSLTVEAEYKYTSTRIADVRLIVESQGDIHETLVEVKLKNDNPRPGQLEDYVLWCKHSPLKRKLVVLTELPLDETAKMLIKKNAEFAKVMTITEYADALKKSEPSEYSKMLLDYFEDEGYCMYNINEVTGDFEALVNFMVLTFLPHESGWGDVAISSRKNISTGPVVFSKLVQNWQLVSETLAKGKLSFPEVPTIRYLADQKFKQSQTTCAPNELDYSLKERRSFRPSRDWGQYWFLSSGRFKNNGDEILLEWNQILRIQHGSRYSDEKIIESGIIVYILLPSRKVAAESKIKWYRKNGIRDVVFSDPNKLSSAILDQIKSAIRDFDRRALKDSELNKFKAIFKAFEINVRKEN